MFYSFTEKTGACVIVCQPYSSIYLRENTIKSTATSLRMCIIIIVASGVLNIVKTQAKPFARVLIARNPRLFVKPPAAAHTHMHPANPPNICLAPPPPPCPSGGDGSRLRLPPLLNHAPPCLHPPHSAICLLCKIKTAWSWAAVDFGGGGGGGEGGGSRGDIGGSKQTFQ